MFGLFKKKSPEEQLTKKYELLLKQSHAVSNQDRTKSDQLYSEAMAIADQIETIKKAKQDSPVKK